MSELKVTGLWKGYGAVEVLRGVDLDVGAGSLTAVLGRSGGGKTTLLRVIAGFERAERGSVALAGRTLDDGHTWTAPESRNVGYVPQEGALFPHLNVEQNVGFGLTRRERRGGGATGALMEMVGIGPLAKRMPHELSGGEQQRTALARALAKRPKALLLDEPFSSLDASLRGQVREEVHGLLREQGVTTVLVTHDQEEALSMADVVAVLRDGRIVQKGTPEELYEQPVDERLARFLGAANVIEARFEGGIARTALGTLRLRGEAGRNGTAGAGTGAGAVMVRPEQIELRLVGEDDAGEGVGEKDAAGGRRGRVEECRYYGHDAMVEVRLEGPEGGEMVLARVHGEEAPRVGTRVFVVARGAVSPVEAAARATS